MSKYYTTVNYVGGKNQLTAAVNDSIKIYRDMLITTDESKEIAMRNITELIASLNEKHPRCTPLQTRRFNSVQGSEYIHISAGKSDCVGSVWFHPITAEL